MGEGVSDGVFAFGFHFAVDEDEWQAIGAHFGEGGFDGVVGREGGGVLREVVAEDGDALGGEPIEIGGEAGEDGVGCGAADAGGAAHGGVEDFDGGDGLDGADEHGGEFAVHLLGDFRGVEAGFGEEAFGVIDGVDAGGFEVDTGESGGGEFGFIVRFFEGAGDAADPEFDVAFEFGGDFAADDDIADGEAAAGFEDAEGFAEDAVFVGGEVDDAVGNDDVDGVIGEGDVFDFALEEFDVLDAGFLLIVAGEGEHVVGHVETVGLAGGADAAGGEKDVDTAAGAEIENGFAGLELGEGGGVATAEGGEEGGFGEGLRLGEGVEAAGDGIGAAAAGFPGGDAAGGFTVLLANYLFDIAFDLVHNSIIAEIQNLVKEDFGDG